MLLVPGLRMGPKTSRTQIHLPDGRFVVVFPVFGRATGSSLSGGETEELKKHIKPETCTLNLKP